jgi:hypothetical protein
MRPFTRTEVLDELGLLGPDTSRVSGPESPEVQLALPRRAEGALARARQLEASGRLHDALAALDGVRLTDPERADADRTRAEIQRELLALPSSPGDGRTP